MKNHAILSAAADVSRSIFFAAAIIIAAFLPLFTLSGVEGYLRADGANLCLCARRRPACDLHDHTGVERDHLASVSAAIGFIALFGIAVMDGIIILSQYNQLIDQGFERIRAVIRTGELQLRPVLMTCVVAGVGLLPAAISAGIGSQVQKPLAVVVVTGMMLAPLVILVTLPVLISVFSRRAR
jgi:Cu/Ag efflux pump CusA